MRLLLVEDNPGDARLIRELARCSGRPLPAPHVVRDMAGALESLQQGSWDVVLLDLGLPDSQGLETFTTLDAAHPEVPVVVLSGLGDESVALEAVRLGAQDYLNKDDLTGDLLGRAVLYAKERHHAELQRRAWTEQWQATFDAIGDAVCLLDPEQRIVRMNLAMQELVGGTQDEITGRRCYEVVHGCTAPPQSCAFQQMARTLRRTTVEAQAGDRWFEIRMDPLLDEDGGLAGAVHTMSDVTERHAADLALRDAHERLARGMRLESLGRLAGGIAHDFNNMLSVVLTNAELIAQDHPDDPQLLDDLSQIKEAADSATGLVKQLLAFGRRQTLDPVLLDCSAAVRDLEGILRRLLGEDIALCCELETGLGSVRADPSQIEQIIMNLAINARDAMPFGGQLTLTTRSETLQGDPVSLPPGCRAGPHVIIEVRDTGHGMDDETRARLFEPFFTTKATGRGTGLGLATVYGIVSQSGGGIRVRSALGKGTTFEILLPTSEGEATEASLERPHSAGRPGHETLLVVEDERALRKAMTRALRREGYTVLEAGDHGEATRIARQHRAQIDLLITDVVLPGPSGKTIAEVLSAERPELRVLFISGYAHDHITKRGVLPRGLAFLQKPFASGVLSRTIREILDSEATDGSS